MKAEDFKEINVKINDAEIDDVNCIEVQKPDANLIPDDNTYAELKNLDFHNGSIEVKVFSRLKKTAPDYARGFIGLTFRGTGDAFESFYIRPTNGLGCEDPVRYKHTIQYFSYPKYTFAYFRDHNITDYENHADIEMEKWIDLKAVVQDEHADFYVNGKHVLHVSDLKMGRDAHGSVGLYVDIGTDGFFRDLKVEEK